MKHARKVLGSAFVGGMVVAACVVPDVELVDELPGGGSSGTSGRGGNESQGGEPSPSGGSDDSVAGGGSGPGTAGDAALGGAGSGGSSGDAGAAGEGTAGGKSGPFPEVGVCDSGGDFAWCEPFGATMPVNDWINLPLTKLEKCARDACPSPDGYLLTGFDEVTPALNLSKELGAKVSFWARFDEDAGDKVFVSFETNDQGPIMFGREGGYYRWRYGEVTTGERSAPSSTQKTVAATVGTWACIELMPSSTRLSARIVPFGKGPVVLPDVDFQATAGEDDAWLELYTAPIFDFDGNFSFGHSGSSVLIDDIAIGPVNSLSSCDYYLQQSQ